MIWYDDKFWCSYLGFLLSSINYYSNEPDNAGYYSFAKFHIFHFDIYKNLDIISDIQVWGIWLFALNQYFVSILSVINSNSIEHLYNLFLWVLILIRESGNSTRIQWFNFSCPVLGKE